MKNVQKLLVVLALVSTVAGTLCQATITSVLAYYKLGEADPGAVAGNTGNATTVDSSGSGWNLTKIGSPTYSSDVTTNALGSTLSMQLSASNSYNTNVAVNGAVANVGLEAWVKPAPVDNNIHAAVLNGNGGNGYGFVESNGNWFFLEGGVAFNAGPAVVPNEWVHLGLVLDSSGNLHGYVNGTQVVIGGGAISPSGGFYVGNGFDGAIDQVRVFTFTGAFDPNDFLIGVIPEPSTLLLLAVGGVFLWRYSRRWQTSHQA